MITTESHRQVQVAAALLRAGGVVAFPTETVYGLGADISHASAIRRIFEIKNRPADHPLIVHIASSSQLSRWAGEVPEQARQLAEHLWPGPLTLILPRSQRVSESVTGGQDTVGLRVPDHPVALALLNALGPERALAAPSANRFGRVSPTTSDHVHEELGDAVDMVLEGGPCRVGLESTIIGFEGKTAVVLRPGGIPLAALTDVLKGGIVVPESAKLAGRTVRVPGALSSHYAPLTPLELRSSADIGRRALELEAEGLRVGVMEWSGRCCQSLRYTGPDRKRIVHVPMPAEPEDYGRKLYATLRRYDRDGIDRLLIEVVPEDSAWMAIADRLRRASGGQPVRTGDASPIQLDEVEEAEDTAADESIFVDR